MVVFRSSAIAGKWVLFALRAEYLLNSSLMMADSKLMFGLDPSRIRQMRRALKRLAQPGRQWVSFTFLTTDELACLIRLAERQPFRGARPKVTYKSNHIFQDFDIQFLYIII